MYRTNCFIYTNSSILSNELEKYSLISFVVPTNELRELCILAEYYKKHIDSFKKYQFF